MSAGLGRTDDQTYRNCKHYLTCEMAIIRAIRLVERRVMQCQLYYESHSAKLELGLARARVHALLYKINTRITIGRR
jgi:hypothetical protein